MQQVYDLEVRNEQIRVVISYIDPTTTATIIRSPDDVLNRQISGGYANRNPKEAHDINASGRLAVKRALGLDSAPEYHMAYGEFESVEDLVAKVRHDRNRMIYAAFRQAQREQKKTEELPLESYEILAMLRKQVSNAAMLIPVAGPIDSRVRLLINNHQAEVEKLTDLLKKIDPYLRMLSDQADAAGNGSLVIGISNLLAELRSLTND